MDDMLLIISNPTTTTTTTTLSPDIYRFGGFRYGMRGTAKYGPDDMIPQETALYTFPKGEESQDPSISIYDPSAPV